MFSVLVGNINTCFGVRVRVRVSQSRGQTATAYEYIPPTPYFLPMEPHMVYMFRCGRMTNVLQATRGVFVERGQAMPCPVTSQKLFTDREARRTYV